MKCEHDFAFHVSVFMFEDRPGNGSAEIQGACTKCRERIVFQGCPIGAGNQPMIDPDGHELRVPVTLGDAEFTGGIEFRIRRSA